MPKLMSCLILALALAACAARPGPEALEVLAPPPADAERQITLWAATAREPEPGRPGVFGSGRSERLSFLRYVVSVPPGHKAAAMECPEQGPPDPARHFAALERQELDEAGLLAQLGAPDVGAGQGSRGRVGVFVHGYNTNFQEGVLRLAQLVADNPAPNRPLLFSWPSDGRMAGYVADKDAAAFSRDHLARLLILLAADPRVEGVDLAAHSMGCWLAMESLRQLRLSGRGAVLDRLDTVLLAAPDIDLDVFRAQAEAVGRLDPPITVLASPDDRALRFSNRLGGDRERVGGLDVHDPRIQALAEDYGIRLIDISNMAATDSLNHDRFIGAAATLRTVLTPRKSDNPFRRAGAYVMDAVATVLETPGRIGRAAAEGVR